MTLAFISPPFSNSAWPTGVSRWKKSKKWDATLVMDEMPVKCQHFFVIIFGREAAAGRSCRNHE
jgi:hypothetical protein